jgi:two-component system KDP operon response regulator KdpE
VRILVVAATPADRLAIGAAVEALGYDFRAAVAADASAAATRRFAPDLVLLDAPSEAVADALLERVRGAAERPLAAVLLLPERSPRLRLAARADGVAVLPRGELDGVGSAIATHDYVHGRARPRHVRLRLDADIALLSANGESVHLTRSESALAEVLLAKPGEVVTSADLATAVWRGRERPLRVGTALRTHIYTLRAKLADIAPEARIENVVSVGYRLRLSERER